MFDEKEFTLDKIKKIHSFMENSKFYKIYDVFSKSCKNFPGDFNDESCYKDSFVKIVGTADVTDLLEELYSRLYRVYVSIPYGYNNTYFEFDISEYGKMYCISLKYWLYDQIIIKGLEKSKIGEIFTGWETYINNKISNIPPNRCVFNKLSLHEIKRLKNIYALYTVLYDNDKFESCNKNTCKYLEYVGKGLDELISSINSCSSNLNQTDYCNEFKEFLDLCKEDNADAGISIYEESTKSNAERKGKYLLTSQKYQDQPLYIYIKKENLLNYVKKSDFLSNKSTTIAATSVVGSAIGLSSIFYYLYKFTPFGSTLRKGKGKNIVNIDEGAHSSLLYTSDADQTQFEKRKYNVAYHSFSDT